MRKIVGAFGLALTVMFMALPVTTPAFAGPAETGDKCFDGRDNDRDGLIDADDPDCAEAPPPPPPGPTLEDQVTELQTQVAELQGLVSSLQTNLAANTAADNTSHHNIYTDAEAIAAVGPHNTDHSNLLAGVYRLEDPNTGIDTLRFEGINVQIVNGTGVTESVDGTGNLIIGYNELRGTGDERNGSHMLVIGSENNYTSAAYGGMVVGNFNESSNHYSSVSGGTNNIASEINSSVSGGRDNIAGGFSSSVSGGFNNIASGSWSSVSGGSTNIASGVYSSVSGGGGNSADEDWSSVSGGAYRHADVTSCILGDSLNSCL